MDQLVGQVVVALHVLIVHMLLLGLIIHKHLFRHHPQHGNVVVLSLLLHQAGPLVLHNSLDGDLPHVQHHLHRALLVEEHLLHGGLCVLQTLVGLLCHLDHEHDEQP